MRLSPRHATVLVAFAACCALVSACGSADAGAGDLNVTTMKAAHATHGHTLAPAGAPYRYTIPPGFIVARSEVERENRTATRYDSMVLLGRFDLISVKVLPLKMTVDASRLPALVASISPELRSEARTTGARIGSISQTTVARHPALRYRESHLLALPGSPPAAAVRMMIFGRSYAVVVSCQWTRASVRSRILAGCAELQHSLVLR
jgi:hypothetical protein